MTKKSDEDPEKVLPKIVDKVLAFKPAESKILKATHGSSDRPLIIGNVKIPCYVLENGQRVLSQRGLNDALGISHGSARNAKGGGARLAGIVGLEGVRSRSDRDLVVLLENPIHFLPPLGKVSFGYEATLLSDICKAILAAHANGTLPARNAYLAKQAAVLLEGFSKIGLVALVDEATGFQSVRPSDDLQRFLALYLSPERLKWARAFPDVFYQHMYRLWGWKWTGGNKRTPHVGKLTNQLVYEVLPEGVLEELRIRNPKVPGKHWREAKHHQELSADIGQDDLQKHLLQVITLMKVSKTKSQFMRNFRALFPSKHGDQLLLDEVADHLDQEAEKNKN
jgi:hypothetical protein